VTDVLSGRVFCPSERPSAFTHQQFGDDGCSFPWIAGILYKDFRTKALNFFLFYFIHGFVSLSSFYS